MRLLAFTFSLFFLSTSLYSATTTESTITPPDVTPLHTETTEASPSDIDVQTTVEGGGTGSVLPACTSANSTNCKDENGEPANGNDCIDVCTVTREITGPQVGNVGTIFSQVDCPAGYNVKSAYNMGVEYVWSGAQTVSPVPNQAMYSAYQAAGWTCNNAADGPYTHGGGVDGCWNPSHTRHPNGFNDLAYCDGTPALVNITSSKCPSPAEDSVDCNAGAWKWQYTGYYTSCSISGHYSPKISSQEPYPNAPTSLICGRVKEAWTP